MKLLIFIVCTLTLEGLCLKIQYNGDQVFKLVLQTKDQTVLVQRLCRELQLDLWRPTMVENIQTGKEIIVRVPFLFLSSLKEKLHHSFIPYEVIINDVQKFIDNSMVSEYRRSKRLLADFNYAKYHPMDVIYEWMVNVSQTYSDLVTMHYLGSTFEIRPIYYFKIGWPSEKNKKIIWMDCGIHAREWISMAFCQWFVKEILESHKTNPLLQKALYNIDFYIVPVLNIDGYIYSWTTDRLWRKSRSSYNNETCIGVDLNRNFASAWCSIGASHKCSDITYCGTGPESEPEVKAVSNLLRRHKADVLCYLTIHSFGQLILLPYGRTKDPSVNHNEMLTVAQKAANNLKQKHGTQYRFGSTSLVLYENSGSSRDWAADLGVNFSYTFELRDNGTFKFLLPEDQIKPTCEETMAGVLTIVEHVHEKYVNSAANLFSLTVWINMSLSILIALHYSEF
ncbi:hypothetical protein GDO86_017125 [Hymenochirus boettgeri]|uniref:Carboxypeptidase O n=1 Tax=Hymenochirus boettgeri TaxID=247094 RepID=A0A8T2ILB8_9PIPI|nr:hypothetical protein GDO86_017125 [Hymenochirus boettgeri]